MGQHIPLISKVIVKKKIFGNDDGEAKTHRYFYDNEDIVAEYLTKADDGKAKTEATRYIHGPGIDEPLAVEQKREAYYYHADGLGSIVALTDKKTKVVQSYDYDSFGNMHKHGDKVKQPYAFAGREWDKETGLYFNRARYYDARAGRFTQKDPIGFDGGDVNLYVYAKDNPLSGIDPSGMESISFKEGIRIVDIAKTWIGVKYLRGGASRNGIDCSHLVRIVYKEAGFPYPYMDTELFKYGYKDYFEPVSSPQEGDVVLFSGHMGIYTNGQTISARSGLGKVDYGKLSWYGTILGYYRYDKCNPLLSK